jgi:hypothetical protein
MEELTHVFWHILSEYISARDQETAAHHLISELADAGATEDEIWDITKGNAVLKKVATEILGDHETALDEDE